MTKVVENTFRDINIVYANELMKICHQDGKHFRGGICSVGKIAECVYLEVDRFKCQCMVNGTDDTGVSLLCCRAALCQRGENLKAVVYGTGLIAVKTLPYLEREYDIICCVDSDQRKWGTKFKNYKILSPLEINRCEYDRIIVASIKYAYEIAGQLVQMGVARERIYLCRLSSPDSADGFDIYPFLPELLETPERQLVQYDQQNTEGSNNTANTTVRSVLIFCSFGSCFVKQVVENISKRYDDLELSILTASKMYPGWVRAKGLKHIYHYASMAELKDILENLPQFDVVQMLWIESDAAFFHKLFRERAKRLLLYIGGSDFYRASDSERVSKRELIMCADGITTETEDTLREFQAYYGEELAEKMSILPYGDEVLEYIRSGSLEDRDNLKKRLGIPLDKVVVTCGHNASAAHRHMDMIDALEKLPVSIREQIVCVFPMTYPSAQEEYISSIQHKLSESALTYIVLTQFMNFEEMGHYALGSDIMIHVQTTDELSGTMLEELYAGSVVIAGRWLPYQCLRDIGVFFEEVGEVSGLTEKLTEIVPALDQYREKCIPNKAAIWNRCSWDAAAPQWRAIWDG